MDSTITVAFNRPVVPLVGTGEQAGLPQPLVITPTLTGKGRMDQHQHLPLHAGERAGRLHSVHGDGPGRAGRTPPAASWRSRIPLASAPRTRPWSAGSRKTAPTSASNGRSRSPSPCRWTAPAPRRRSPSWMKPRSRLQARFNWNKDGTELGFKPAQLLKFGAKYEAGVGLTARAAIRAGHAARQSAAAVPLPHRAAALGQAHRSGAGLQERRSERRRALRVRRPDGAGELRQGSDHRAAQADAGLHLLQRERKLSLPRFLQGAGHRLLGDAVGQGRRSLRQHAGRGLRAALPHARPRPDPPAQQPDAGGHLQRLHRHAGRRALPQPAGGALRSLLGDAG